MTSVKSNAKIELFKTFDKIEEFLNFKNVRINQDDLDIIEREYPSLVDPLKNFIIKDYLNPDGWKGSSDDMIDLSSRLYSARFITYVS